MAKKYDMTIGGKRMAVPKYQAVHNASTGDIVGEAAVGKSNVTDLPGR